MQRLIQGITKFQRDVFPQKSELFHRLALGQHPSTLFITCADSRVSPTLFTQSEPGEIFTIRNAGNIVPAYRLPAGGVTSGIEFAVAILHVTDIVICGHTDCGAMKGLLHPERFAHVPAVADWLAQAEATRRLVLDNYQGLDDAAMLDVMIRENVLVQLQNLQTHPSVLSRLAAGNLKLYGWIYDIGQGRVESFDAARQSFIPLDGSCSPEATPVARLRRPAAASPQA